MPSLFRRTHRRLLGGVGGVFLQEEVVEVVESSLVHFGAHFVHVQSSFRYCIQLLMLVNNLALNMLLIMIYIMMFCYYIVSIINMSG